VQDTLLVVLAQIDDVAVNLALESSDKPLPSAVSTNWTHQLLKITVGKFDLHGPLNLLSYLNT
jgi:hypothetical protein